MKIISFDSCYLEEVIEIFNSSYPYYQIDKQMMNVVLFTDENFDPDLFLLAVDNGKLLGYVIGIIRKYPYLDRGLQEDRAWIMDLAVRNEYRDRNVGKLLLEEIEKKLGDRTIHIGAYSPQYFFYGLDDENSFGKKLYLDNNYQLGEKHYWMEKDLSNYQQPLEVQEIKSALNKEGLEFLPYNDDDGAELLMFLRNNFTAGWIRNAANMIKNHKLNNHCIVCKDKGKIIGYIQRSIDSDEKRFGPFGVDEAYRGKKIGTILLHEMWQQIKDAGNDYCFFKTTEDNAKRLYQREGMEVKHLFYSCQKNNRKEGLI